MEKFIVVTSEEYAQDPQWMPGTSDSTEPIDAIFFPYTYVPMIKLIL